jgi:hypothetical protein
VVAEEVLLHLVVQFGSQFHHHILELRDFPVDELAKFGVLGLLLPHHSFQLFDFVLRFFQLEP